MLRKREVVYLMMAVGMVAVLYFYFIGNGTSEKVLPSNTNTTIENSPITPNIIPSKEKEASSIPIEKQPVVSPPAFKQEKIKPLPSLLTIPQEDSVNLEEQSYSITNQKKDIPIVPGVTLERGKSVNIKVADGGEIIRIQRDKNYHPGGYNVLFEKKY